MLGHALFPVVQPFSSPPFFPPITMGNRDLNLDGAEISVLKALGLGSSETSGADLIKRVQDLEPPELIDTLKGLIAQGFVDADKSGFYSLEDMEPILFMVNSGYTKDLKDALNPKPEAPKSRRVRRE
jgi:hypothetical protein